MLTIRLLRTGKKNQPSFKIVVTEKRTPPVAGRFIEEVGFYNPLTKERVLKGERIKHWISVGAAPSPTAHNLFVQEKIIEGKKIKNHRAVAVQPKAEEEALAEEAAPAKEAKPAEAAPTEPETAPETPTEEPKAQE